MANLFPEDYKQGASEGSELAGNTVIGYRGSVAFDDENGDYVRNGKNQLLDSPGIESWKNWCRNCISTQRYAHLAYSTDFGIDIEAAMKAGSREEAELILSREIEDALMADKYGRTEFVSKIEYNWTAPDSVEVHVTIYGIDSVTIDITATLTAQK